MTGRGQLDGESASELPAREALSLIDASGSVLPVDAAAVDAGELASADPTSGAADEAGNVANTTADASPSGSGKPDVTSSDRQQTYSSTDTASSST